MKHNFTVNNDCLLFTAVSENVGGVSLPALKTLLKAGEIRVNGTKQYDNAPVKKGDTVLAFIPAKYLSDKKADIIYADENILVVDKPPYVDVENNLLSDVKIKYPTALAVHRLDRNTAGLVIFALNQPAYLSLVQAFKDRTLDKYYLATVVGNFTKSGVFTAYLKKDSERSIVEISDTPKAGYIKIITEITPVTDLKKISPNDLSTPKKTSSEDAKERTTEKSVKISKTKTGETSLLMVKLVTGRTHQIRAHLSHLGFPILGDGKYGKNVTGKNNGAYALTAYKIILKGLKPPLVYLNGRVFETTKENIK